MSTPFGSWTKICRSPAARTWFSVKLRPSRANLSRAAGGMGEGAALAAPDLRSEEHTSELQSLMRISYAVFCLKKKKNKKRIYKSNKYIYNHTNTKLITTTEYYNEK